MGASAQNPEGILVQAFAIILTHNRPDLLQFTAEAISPQVDQVLVIDNASEPPIVKVIVSGKNASVLTIPDQPPNLPELWLQGIDWCDKARTDRNEPWRIAFLCDDSPPPPGWFNAVTEGMNVTGAVIGCSNPWGTPHGPRVKTRPDHDIAGRMVGWAFVLNPDSGVRPDPSMHWWWCDTSMDFDARVSGGMVMVGGYPVPNQRMGEWTNVKPELGAQVGRDREAFAAKHGFLPW